MDAGLIPDDIEGLKAALIAAIAEAAVAKPSSEDQALIVHLKLEIEKLKRTIYGRGRTHGASSARPDGAAARGT